MTSCPHCGSTVGYTFKDPGVLVFVGLWGEGKQSEVHTHTEHHFKRPVTASCVKCGEPVKLTEARRNR